MRTNETKTRAGFTLAELMVVIVIIGLLATLVVPNVVRRLFAATRATAEANIMTIAQALDSYAVENMGRYPDTLEALVTPDENGHTFLNRETVPTDPWGQPYVYEPPSGGRKLNVISYGKDTAPGGEGDDADITYEALRNK
ncbi:MAG: type II secretion system major pseudopilin GspG [Planctomycetes bacterium]|nr:type II secretion system major pseudopilin GspG [Planctomycetota bacterium]